jgi:Bacterial Ig-like domain (group 1)
MVALPAAALLTGQGMAASAQTPPPTLTEEYFAAFPPDGSITITSQNCDPSGFSIFTFDASGSATGPGGPATSPYPGTFSESGTAVIGPENLPLYSNPTGLVMSFNATFTIDSPVGQVRGSKTYSYANQALPAIGFCGDPVDGSLAAANGCCSSSIDANYNATIDTSSGQFADHGLVDFLVEAGGSATGQSARFSEVFSSQQTTVSSSKVAYVFDFGTGLNDGSGPGSSSSIFANAVTGSGLIDGGAYNGATFHNVPVSTVDASPSTAFNGFDTVILYEVCDIAAHPNLISAVNSFIDKGGKLMIFDGDRCAPLGSGFGVAGVPDYTGFEFPFQTTNPGPQGASGPYTLVETSTLTTGLPAAPPPVAIPGDAVGDANIFSPPFAGGWCSSIQATNVIGTNNIVEAYARTVAGGLVIYEGEDFWFTLGPTAHLKLVFDDMLAQPFNPDLLPCTNPPSGIKLEPAAATDNIGSNQTETATVVDSTANPKAGITVTFKVTSGPDAGTTGTGLTDASGHATFTFSDTTLPGVDIVVASFTDTGGTHNSNNSVITWVKRVTTLTVNNSTGDFNDSATLSGTLQDSSGNPIVGATVTFTVSGQSCAGVTDASGSASCAIAPNEAAGPYTITGSYAGSASLLPASGTGTLVVTLEETTIMYTGPTNIANASPATLSAILLEDGVTPIAGRTVTLTLGSGGTAQSCIGVTNGAGIASCTIASVNQPGGAGTATASFAGDAFYRPATDTKPILNFSFLATGSFVIGDHQNSAIGNSVTFWDSTWLQDNSLASGPHSFKGFAQNPTTPSCGVGWSADTGNSTPPPAGPLPAFMGVIVTSSATQSGSTVSGNTVHIVIVQTNPGYAPDPGHAGTGKVVATFC